MKVKSALENSIMKLTTMSEKWGEFRILDLVRMYLSDEKLINTEKFQVSSFYRF